MTNRCSITSRVLPPGVHLGTGLSVTAWLLTTDHRSGWSVPWPLCQLICRWPPGYWPPITSLVDLLPGLSVTLRVVHVIIFCWHHQLPMTDQITALFKFLETSILHSVRFSFVIFFSILNFEVILFFTFSQHVKVLNSKVSYFFTNNSNYKLFQPTQNFGKQSNLFEFQKKILKI